VSGLILEAKRLALYSEINMKEIAYELGFIDLAISVNFLKLLLVPIFPISKKKKLSP
jgi:AraC-like DNA-binding protein